MRWFAAFVFVLVVVACLAGQVRSAEPSTITLRDGSVIQGEVLFMGAGVYTVRSTTLGTVTIAASDIKSVSNEPPSQAGAAPAPTVAAPSLDGFQQRLASDPEAMKDIMALQDSPDLQAVLDDPDIQAAIRSGDLQALMSNPKITRLASDPRVQRLVERAQ